MINWQELAIRADLGPWSWEEHSALYRLTTLGSIADSLTQIVNLIKSASFPGVPNMELDFLPDMSFAVWGERGSLLDWSQRRRFTNLTLKTAVDLADAVNATEKEETSAVYAACLVYQLSKPKLFDV